MNVAIIQNKIFILKIQNVAIPLKDFFTNKFNIAFLKQEVQSLNIFSMDVEDWFSSFNFIEPPKIEEWDSLPSIVEKGFYRVSELLLKYKTDATFFFLGWIAKKYPHLVKEAKKNGFEIASHGFYHQKVFKLSHNQFFEDIVSTKKFLEDIAGENVLGYRAPSFTFTNDIDWFFPTLIEAGYKFDSSLFPAKRQIGGFSFEYLAPFEIVSNGGKLIEFPITVAKVLSKPLCFFGGGYLRFFPFFIFNIMAKQVEREHRPLIVYIHPREFEPEDIRLKMSLVGKFKSYVNINSTTKKIEKILSRFRFTSFTKYILQNYGRIE